MWRLRKTKWGTNGHQLMPANGWLGNDEPVSPNLLVCFLKSHFLCNFLIFLKLRNWSKLKQTNKQKLLWKPNKASTWKKWAWELRGLQILLWAPQTSGRLKGPEETTRPLAGAWALGSQCPMLTRVLGPRRDLRFRDTENSVEPPGKSSEG